MAHHLGDLFPDETAAGTNVMSVLVFLGTEVLCTIAHWRLELNQPQTTARGVTDVRMKRDAVTFQFIALRVQNMEFIAMMDNPIEM
jgi:hypothetical protein